MESKESVVVLHVEGAPVIFGVTARTGREFPPAVTQRLVDAAAHELQRLLPELVAREEESLRRERPDLMAAVAPPAAPQTVNGHAAAAVPYHPL
jgi:hypothetical protein